MTPVTITIKKAEVLKRAFNIADYVGAREIETSEKTSMGIFADEDDRLLFDTFFRDGTQKISHTCSRYLDSVNYTETGNSSGDYAKISDEDMVKITLSMPPLFDANNIIHIQDAAFVFMVNYVASGWLSLQGQQKDAERCAMQASSAEQSLKEFLNKRVRPEDAFVYLYLSNTTGNTPTQQDKASATAKEPTPINTDQTFYVFRFKRYTYIDGAIRDSDIKLYKTYTR